MITSIYSMQYPDEALECVAVGADWIGLLTGDDSCPAAVSLEQAKKIYDAVADRAIKVAILMQRDEDRLLDAAEYLRPDIIQLCDDTVFATKEFCEKARRRIPGIKIMQAVAVGGPETRNRAIGEAKRYAENADYLILDSYIAGTSEVGATPNGVGAAGISHDWSISADIVREVKVPVVLAGGLWGENVEAAIERVRPFGVDSLTKTTIVENGVYIRKDIEKVRDFVEKAHSFNK